MNVAWDCIAPGAVRIRRALLSVSEKSGIVDFARGLSELGVEIVSTGGTARALADAGLAVRAIEDFTGFPEMMDGRVKTLHPRLYAGLLARRDDERHVRAAAEQGIEPVDLVCVNLYPFERTVARGDASPAEAIENIDIGGPTMIRAAAKNHAFAAVVVDPDDYAPVLAELRESDAQLSMATRERLAARAFAETARYDAAIAAWFATHTERDAQAAGAATAAPPAAAGQPLAAAGQPLAATPAAAGQPPAAVPAAAGQPLATATSPPQTATELPTRWSATYVKQRDLRYGENPHQRGAYYAQVGAPTHMLAGVRQLHGKELSFNNLLDLSSARELADEFAEPACAIVKHNNPCGCALGETGQLAYERAFACDPMSAYGGVIAVNRPVDEPFAQALSSQFIEVLLAPGFTPEALEVLQAKKNVRLLDSCAAPDAGHASQEAASAAPDPSRASPGTPPAAHADTSGRAAANSSSSSSQTSWLEAKPVIGGLLVQDRDAVSETREQMTVMSALAPTEQQWQDMLFAWRVCRHVRSNAIVLAASLATVGIGAGQMSRVDAVRIAVAKAREAQSAAEGSDADGRDRLAGAAMASDAFFPFPDAPQIAIDAGIRAIVQPGGSVRDELSVQAADAAGVTMVATGVRHFRH
jgi:phosphoribosylaminoimidazolecarboxamide formyltransferase/IMP cyclohydrolase